MSYNIDSTDTIYSDAWMYEDDRIRLGEQWEELGLQLPESSFLNDDKYTMQRCWGDLEPHGEPLPFGMSGRAKRHLKHLRWNGSGSGHAIDSLGEIAKYIHGRIDVIATWEGGDSFSGIRIVDGVYTRPKVIQYLEPLPGDSPPFCVGGKGARR